MDPVLPKVFSLKGSKIPRETLETIPSNENTNNSHKGWVRSSETANTEAYFLAHAIPDVYPAGKEDGEP